MGGFTVEMTPQDCVYNVIRRVQSTTQKSVQCISQGLRGFCTTQSLSIIVSILAKVIYFLLLALVIL